MKRIALLLSMIASCFLIGIVVRAAPIADAFDTPIVIWPNETNAATIGNATLSVHFSSRVAGAIDSVVWRGKEFVSSSDHGREIQSAAAFSNGHRECFNPTEAGSAADGTGPSTTSHLAHLEIQPQRLATETQMAYWLPPQDKMQCGYPGSPKDGPLSHDVLRKVVTVGAFGLLNVIHYQSTFIIPEPRQLGGFEAPTGYMPAEFSTFWIYDPLLDHIHQVAGDLNYQSLPIIFSTSDGQYAMGVYSPPQGFPASYGGRRFTGHQMAFPTVKWTIFFRKNEVPAGEQRFDSYLVVGSLSEVRSSIKALYNKETIS